MGRPHIEFLQCQSLEWEPEPLLPGAWTRTLSRDSETGAAIVGLPWRESLLMTATELAQILARR